MIMRVRALLIWDQPHDYESEYPVVGEGAIKEGRYTLSRIYVRWLWLQIHMCIVFYIMIIIYMVIIRNINRFICLVLLSVSLLFYLTKAVYN